MNWVQSCERNSALQKQKGKPPVKTTLCVSLLICEPRFDENPKPRKSHAPQVSTSNGLVLQIWASRDAPPLGLSVIGHTSNNMAIVEHTGTLPLSRSSSRTVFRGMVSHGDADEAPTGPSTPDSEPRNAPLDKKRSIRWDDRP